MVTQKDINKAFKERKKVAMRAYTLIAKLEGMEFMDENSDLIAPKISRDIRQVLQNIQKELEYHYDL